MMKRELRLLLLGVAVVASLAMAAPGLADCDICEKYGSVVSGDSPVAWYRLADALDETTNNHDGTASGGVAYTDTSVVCDHTTAAAFDGTGVITVPDDDALDFGALGDFSVEFWAKRSVGTSNYCVLNKGNSNNAYWMRFNADGSMRFTLDYGSQGDNVTSSSTYADSQWHHYVGVADRDSSVKLYVDGALAGEDTSLNGTGGDISSTKDAGIGEMNGASLYNGLIDEVALYSGADTLTATEIVAHYNAGLAASPVYATVVSADNPVAWYRMADTVGGGTGWPKVDDYSTTGSHDGTAGSGVTLNSATIIDNYTDATGSASLDGTSNGTITVPDDDALDFGTDVDFAIEAWICTTDAGATVFNKGDTYGGYWMRVENDGNLKFNLDFGSTGLNAKTTFTVNDGDWHHVVGVADRDVGVELWVDGSLAVSNGLYDGNDVSSALDLQIGMLGTGSPLTGSIDEVAIYNRVLTAAEVLEHYEHANCIPEPGVLAMVLAGMGLWLAAGRKR